MHKIKNLKKKFCLLIALIGSLIPMTTCVYDFNFNFLTGLGLIGWILLPDEDINNG